MNAGLIADAILAVHAAFVLFVVGGLAAIWWGIAKRRRFAFAPWFRGLHLAAIAYVAAESLFGWPCPLTEWEDALRGTHPEEGFVARWTHAVLFWTAPPWVFDAMYVGFALLVAATWWRHPPRRRR